MLKVYQYGLRPPIENEELIREQLRLAHKYYCALLEAKIAMRNEKRALDVKVPEEVAYEAAHAALDELLTVQARIRAKERRRAEPQELRDAIKAARQHRKEAKEAMQAARKSARADNKDKYADLNTRWLAIRRDLRAKSGLRHGTYTAIEDSVDQADKATPWYDGTEPDDPQFPRWRGTGRVGVQVQDGIFAELLEECKDTRVQLDIHDHARRATYGTLRLRIGSNPDRSPIWASWPIKLHRPIPRGGLIKRIMVSLRRCASREDWTTEITVDVPDVALRERCGTGTIAIDVGWRVIGDELRVATWHDDRDAGGELRLTRWHISTLCKSDELRSIRDRNLDEMKAALLAELPQELPLWLRKRIGRKDEKVPTSAQARLYLSQWRSAGRFDKLARTWEDGPCPTLLEKWRIHDRHLWEWQENQRAQALRARKDFYRVWAAHLARTYHTIVLEDFNLKKVARKAHPEQKGENKHAMSWRQLAAISELRDVICNAMVSRHGEVIKVKAAHSTQDCPDCGFHQVWDAEATLGRRPPCPECGCDSDQDDGASAELLRRWAAGDDRRREEPGGDKTPDGAREVQVPETKESRYERRAKAMRAKKQKQTALADATASV